MNKLFPVLWQGPRSYIADLERLICPRFIPWWLVQKHEPQAMRNHGGQSLEILASRGGLGPDELAAVLEDRPWVKMSTAAQVAALHDLITVCSMDELTVEQIAQADAEGALHVDSDGLRWVPRRWVTLWTQRHKS